jgi:hypothetical protein
MEVRKNALASVEWMKQNKTNPSFTSIPKIHRSFDEFNIHIDLNERRIRAGTLLLEELYNIQKIFANHEIIIGNSPSRDLSDDIHPLIASSSYLSDIFCLNPELLSSMVNKLLMKNYHEVHNLGLFSSSYSVFPDDSSLSRSHMSLLKCTPIMQVDKLLDSPDKPTLFEDNSSSNNKTYFDLILELKKEKIKRNELIDQEIKEKSKALNKGEIEMEVRGGHFLRKRKRSEMVINFNY